MRRRRNQIVPPAAAASTPAATATPTGEPAPPSPPPPSLATSAWVRWFPSSSPRGGLDVDVVGAVVDVAQPAQLPRRARWHHRIFPIIVVYLPSLGFLAGR